MTKRSHAEICAEFVEAIETLGGRVLPMLVHDDPLQVEVPPKHRATAEALMQKLRVDLGTKSLS